MKLKHIKIIICEACLDGKGQECHTPGCALFLHRVDLPIHPELYEVEQEFDSEGLHDACVDALASAGVKK